VKKRHDHVIVEPKPLQGPPTKREKVPPSPQRITNKEDGKLQAGGLGGIKNKLQRSLAWIEKTKGEDGLEGS